MTVLTVRNLDEGTLERLKTRAAANGRSMEGEARQILAAAVAPERVDRGLGSRIAALFADEALPDPGRSDEQARAAGFGG